MTAKLSAEELDAMQALCEGMAMDPDEMRHVASKHCEADSDFCVALGQGADALEALPKLLAQVRESEALKVDVEAMRVNLHATFNGGHHDEPARRAFHHGMDTVCNVLAAHQQGKSSNGILPPPPAQREVVDPVGKNFDALVRLDEAKRSTS